MKCFFFFIVPEISKKKGLTGGLRNTSGLVRVASFYVDAFSPQLQRVTATVILARHGSHAEVGRILSGRSDIALSAEGRREAEWLAGRLADAPLAGVHSSPRRRAMETASIVAHLHGLRVERIDALDEVDFGDWSGCSFAALSVREDWVLWNAKRGSAATPAGETMAAVTARAVRHIEALPKEGTMLCVSHCDVIRPVAAHYLGLEADRLLAFDCDPGSITILQFDASGGRVATLNERAR